MQFKQNLHIKYKASSEVTKYPIIEGRNIHQFNCSYTKPNKYIVENINIINYKTLAVRRITCGIENTRTCICCIIENFNMNSSLNYLNDKCDDLSLLFLCGLLNSFIIDFYIRLKINGVNLTTNILNNIPIIPYNENISKLVEMIINDVNNQELRNQLDALIAKLYDITYEELEYILSTFNIVEQEVKEDILRRFDAI